MRNASVIDAVAWFFILLWLALSAYFCFIGHGDMFQRVGAIGIAVGVGYFAAVPLPLPHPTGTLERLSLQDGQLLEMARGIATSNANVVSLARAISNDRVISGQSVSESLRAIAELPTASETALGNVGLFESFEVRRLENLKVSESADRQVVKVGRNMMVFQAIVVVFGTLQSGFGSLFFNGTCKGILTC